MWRWGGPLWITPRLKGGKMDKEQTRISLIEQAKAYGIPEELLKNLTITSLRKIVDYEREADATKKV